MSPLASEIDLALQRLDPSNAARLDACSAMRLALAFGVEADAKPTHQPEAANRLELFSRRFAPLAVIPDRDLSDVVNENRGEASSLLRIPASSCRSMAWSQHTCARGWMAAIAELFCLQQPCDLKPRTLCDSLVFADSSRQPSSRRLCPISKAVRPSHPHQDSALRGTPLE